MVEPVFRDADIVSIDIGAVRQSDAPATTIYLLMVFMEKKFVQYLDMPV